jgi:cytochrome oxidase assembly protein ShyY1
VRSWRFLLSRRWVLFAIAVAVLAVGTWWLGEWQFHRLQERQDKNHVVEANLDRPAAPVGDVLAVGDGADRADEWRQVTATGEYAVDHTVIVRYRSGDDGASGVDVVVPLVTDEGPALVVDRGFLAVDSSDGVPSVDDVPAPPPGQVTVTGWVRVDGTGDSTQVSDGSTRAINSTRIGEATGLEVYGGFVDLASENPEPDEALERAETPDLGEGPHFFYGLQWWFFGLLAIGGFGYLAWDERRRPRAERPARPTRERLPRRTNVPAGSQRPTRKERAQRARSMPPSTGTIEPETNDAAGESRKAATRPNSSGRP